MDIGYVISDSLKYPTSDWKRMSALGLLLFASIFIIPLFFAFGYLFRVIKASLAGSEELPAFEEWGGMFVDGIKVFLVYLLYTLTAIIIGIYSLVVLFSTLYSLTYLYPTTVPLSNATLINSILGGSVIFGIIFSIIYMVVIYPIIAVALGNMAFYDGEFGSAFNLSEILSTISQIGWVDLINMVYCCWISGYGNLFHRWFTQYNPDHRIFDFNPNCVPIHVSLHVKSNSMALCISI